MAVDSMAMGRVREGGRWRCSASGAEWWPWILSRGEGIRPLMSQRQRRCIESGAGEVVRGQAPTGGSIADAQGLEASAADEVGVQQPPPDDPDPYRGDTSSEEAERRLEPQTASRRSEQPPSGRLEVEGKLGCRRRRDECVRLTRDEDLAASSEMMSRRGDV